MCCASTIAPTTDKKTVINLINHSYFQSCRKRPRWTAKGLQLFAPLFRAHRLRQHPDRGDPRRDGAAIFDFTQASVLGPRLASPDPQIAGKKRGWIIIS